MPGLKQHNNNNNNNNSCSKQQQKHETNKALLRANDFYIDFISVSDFKSNLINPILSGYDISVYLIKALMNCIILSRVDLLVCLKSGSDIRDFVGFYFVFKGFPRLTAMQRCIMASD